MIPKKCGKQEDQFIYYDRSARKDVSIVRDKLNEWFRDIPDSEKREFKIRFTKSFDSTFYELFLFQLFKNLGFEIEIHPTVPESNNKPDFLIKRNELEIYVEAKISTDKSNQEEAQENKLNEFYDSMNKIDSGPFLLYLDTVKFKTEKQPNTRKVKKYIEDELQKLNPDNLEEDLKINGLDGMFKIEYECEDIHVIVKPMPVIKEARTKKRENAIGMFPSNSFMGGAEDSIKGSVNLKAKRYGQLDKPFIVCINALSIKSSSGHDIENVIWGSLAYSYSTNPNSRDEKWIRQNDGVFQNRSGARLTNLSGVLITRVFTSNIPSAQYWLFEHPFSENKFNFEELGLKYNFVKDNQINKCVGDDLDQIFKMDKNWLTK